MSQLEHDDAVSAAARTYGPLGPALVTLAGCGGTVTLHGAVDGHVVVVVSDESGASAGLVEQENGGTGVGAHCWEVSGIHQDCGAVALSVEGGRLAAQGQAGAAWAALIEPWRDGCTLEARDAEGRVVATRRLPMRFPTRG